MTRLLLVTKLLKLSLVYVDEVGWPFVGNKGVHNEDMTSMGCEAKLA